MATVFTSQVKRKAVEKIEKPKCPGCSKLGVEMVETSTKWMCPRCNYQIKKGEEI